MKVREEPADFSSNPKGLNFLLTKSIDVAVLRHCR